MVDQVDAPSTPPGPEPSEPEMHTTDAGASADARQARWLAQLQAMIDNVATAAAPTLREVAAKAAELAAKAGDAAGPFAHKAAEVTSDVGQRVAAKSRDFAADLRRPAENGTEPTTAPEATADAQLPDPVGDAEPRV
jgi:hypothetical protein